MKKFTRCVGILSGMITALLPSLAAGEKVATQFPLTILSEHYPICTPGDGRVHMWHIYLSRNPVGNKFAGNAINDPWSRVDMGNGYYLSVEPSFVADAMESPGYTKHELISPFGQPYYLDSWGKWLVEAMTQGTYTCPKTAKLLMKGTLWTDWVSQPVDGTKPALSVYACPSIEGHPCVPLFTGSTTDPVPPPPPPPASCRNESGANLDIPLGTKTVNTPFGSAGSKTIRVTCTGSPTTARYSVSGCSGAVKDGVCDVDLGMGAVGRMWLSTQKQGVWKSEPVTWDVGANVVELYYDFAQTVAKSPGNIRKSVVYTISYD